MSLFSDLKRDQALQDLEGRLAQAQAERSQFLARLDETQELVRHLDEERDLLLEALTLMRPGLGARELGEALMGICFKPLGLACFYVAEADWGQDQLRFILYHEGGRFRNHPSRRLSSRAGLSERVLSDRRPLYIRTMEEGQASGSLLTAAEQATGLIPHSWYGVPLGWGSHPWGLLSFQSFQTDAFTERRRRVMDGLGALLSTCLDQAP